MKKIYFTPGPAELYPSTIAHFKKGFADDIASISHRSKQFQQIYGEVSEGLKKLLTIPDDYHIFIVGSGTEAMERVIQNCVEKYSFHFVDGSFSKRFFTTAMELDKKPVRFDLFLNQHKAFSKSIIPKKTELICFTHNETSTGVMLPSVDIKKIAEKYPDMLVAVDIVSSAPYVALDYKFFDVVFFSVQKGFGLPAGLGVMIVSPRAIKKAEKLLQKGISIGSYHSFLTLLEFTKKLQTPETPPVIEIYVLGNVIQDMLKVGIKKIREETEQKADMLYEFFEKSDVFFPVVTDPHFRSKTVIVIDTAKTKGDIREILADKGLFIGSGYGANKDTQIRIANFPAHSIKDVQRLIKELKSV